MTLSDARKQSIAPVCAMPDTPTGDVSILRFEPIYLRKIWGGSQIAHLKNIDCQATDIGESWEISAIEGKESVVAEGTFKGMPLSDLCNRFGERLLGHRAVNLFGKRFPLLIKFIDAHSDLSLQVHPNDEIARRRHNSPGKTEMWHIISSAPGAKVYVGFNRRIDPGCYERHLAEGTISEIVGGYTTDPGDTFFIPAGCIHAIGAGNLLVEIQQSSDISYRIFDYNRRDSNGHFRQLHINEAREAIDYSRYDHFRNIPMPIDSSSSHLISCEHFKVDKININGKRLISGDPGSFTVVVCTSGKARIAYGDNEAEIECGQTLLIPAGNKPIEIDGHATLLTAKV